MIYFMLIVIAIIVGIVALLLFILYLPFKKYYLQKSNKRTPRLKRIINWSYYVFLVALFIFLFLNRNYRTSSKTRLENITQLKLPADFKVIKDEYQDMWHDYCIDYEIQFTNASMKKLTQEISTLPNVNEWNKSDSGYYFSYQVKATNYSIEIDTTKNILKYNECAD